MASLTGSAAQPDCEPGLDSLPAFRSLSAETRADLLRNSVVHGAAPGTVLFEQGDVPNFQLIVVAGSVQLFGKSAEGREVLIEVVRAPDLIIPAAVVTGASYLMEARVPESSRILLIHSDAFRRAVAGDLALAHEMIGSLAQQFRRMVRQIKNLKLRSSTQRAGCYILALSKRQGTLDRAVLPYEKNLIASELGITRESFSRALSALENFGIRVDGQTITILDPKLLAAECKPDPLIDEGEAPDSLGLLRVRA